MLDAQSLVIEPAAVGVLIERLREHGYTTVGPTLRDGAIVYDELRGAADLPRGWTDVQAAGTYRVARRGDDALFGYVVGPHSWKRYLFPPQTRLGRARRTDEGFEFEPESASVPRYAFLGVRPCELAAIAIQDRVFLGGDQVDPTYAARRSGAFLVAVQCAQAGNTCFCVSMETGPRAAAGFDLALTELLPDAGRARHELLLEVGSERGAELAALLPTRAALAADLEDARGASARSAASMGRELDTRGIKEALYASLEHPRWDEVARRCLDCANCTLVCPTCFCSSVGDTSDLSGEHAERWRRWDSCFTLAHSELHGGSVRASTRARYRQWLTHKLATWIDQFGTSGCVGCGRCITWCPVGIDLTEEARALRER